MAIAGEQPVLSGARKVVVAEIDFQALGPSIGELFPPVALRSQGGSMVDVHHDRAGRPAVVVFYRSARW